MSRRVKSKPIDRLVMAMKSCVILAGAAQWTNGYRAAIKSTPDGARLYEKEQAQWRRVEREQVLFRRLALRLLREARRSNSGRGETHG